MAFDPTGSIILELRDAPAVAAIVDARVHGAEAPPDTVTSAFRPFVIISRLGTVRMPRRQLQEVRLGMNCFAETPQRAAILTGACVDALHDIGPRFGTGGYGIYRSQADGDEGSPEKDPLTGQPFESSVIALITTIEPVEGS